MEQAMGVINLGNEPELHDLTMYRCCASVPFAGRYRLIDFPLSNMVNAGIKNVGIFVRKKYRSLMDHLGSGKEWDLDRKHGGLFILPPMYDENRCHYTGDVHHLYSHMDFFYRAPESYVIMANGHTIHNVDYREAFRNHLESNADITLLYLDDTDSSGFSEEKRIVKVGENQRIDGFYCGYMPEEAQDRLSLETYIMKKTLFLKIIENSIIEGGKNWIEDGIIRNSHRYTIKGYPCQGYAALVDSIQGYYFHSMELLNPDQSHSLFYQKERIYTKVKDEPPSLYNEGSKVINSLVANGCKIEGRVENSILFRGVQVGKGAVIKNSIILQRCVIGEKSMLEGVIMDKDSFITEGKFIHRKQVEPLVIPKRSII